MQWLNYHHLLYFWTVAHEGSVTAAARKLHLSRPAVTGQIRALEKSLGGQVFIQIGRRLSLTPFGKTVLAYADDIFAAGEELQQAVRGGRDGVQRLTVGIPDVMPKLVVFRLLQPAFNLPERPRLVCREGKLDDLLGELALHRVDLVLTDSPLSPPVSVRAFNHKLGECGVSFFACVDRAPRLRKNFPRSLHEAPMLLPTPSTTLRRLLDGWFEEQDIQPNVIGEFEDSALMKVFGQAGHGAFAAPSVIEKEIVRQYSVKTIGRVDELREHYFAISVERKLKHPAVVAITMAAREKLF